MLYSKNLLSRYLSLKTDGERLTETLTLKSCEVETWTQRNIPHNVVIGKVVSVRDHPNADKLVICQVACGSKGDYQICTGAKNIIAGSYVPVALPGCHLPAINLTIEPRQMRGEDSNGMICSKEELGIGEDVGEHRIRTLQSPLGKRTDKGNESNGSCGDMDDIVESDMGKSLAEKYPWLENRIIDVENKTITHKPEMFGHFGLACELNTLFHEDILFQNIKKHQEALLGSHIFELLENATSAKQQIEIQSENVLSYLLLEINETHVQTSDFYTRLLLTDLGIQPKNNRVDLSNLFMYISGQPVHFFDAEKISGQIVVRDAKEGESFTDLFGKTHLLTGQDIVIADEQKILALAGVVGSQNSGVDENTKNIVVEFGNFDAVAVRKTGTRLGLRTDAEIRFEKYINPLFSLYSLTLFLDEVAFFSKSLGSYDVGGIARRVNEQHDIHVLKKLSLRKEKLVEMVHGKGILSSISQEEFLKAVKQLFTGMGRQVSGDQTRHITVPGRISPDAMHSEADLIEEAARLRGYDRIGQIPYTAPVSFVPHTPIVNSTRHLENMLSQVYTCHQLETYPWIHERRHQQLSDGTASLFTMKNPLSPEQKYLRDSIIRSLIEVAEKNGPFFESFRVFDQGKVWSKKTTPSERTVMGCLFWNREDASFPANEFLEMKGMINDLFRPDILTYQKTEYAFFHPVQQGSIILNGKNVGYLGVVHPMVLESIKLPAHGQLVVCEIDMDAYLSFSLQKTQEEKAYESLQDQIIRKDLSVLVPRQQGFGLVAQILQDIPSITSVTLFDIYEGDGIPSDKKSISVSFKIHRTQQITSEEIQQIMQTAIQKLEEQGVTLRK